MCEQLRRIFDNSACLSRRQLKDYISGHMSREEKYAAEYHVNTCFLCSEALDGLGKKGTVLIFEELDANFLEDHFSLINPQIHLNSIAPSIGAQPVTRVLKKKNAPPLLKPTSIVAALILAFAVLWYLDYEKPAPSYNHPIVTEEQSSSSKRQSLPVRNEKPAQTEQAIGTDQKSGSKTASTDEEGSRPLSNKPQALIATGSDPEEKNGGAADTHLSRQVQPEKQEITKFASGVSSIGVTSKVNEDVKQTIAPSEKTIDTEKKRPLEKNVEEKAEPDLQDANEFFNAGNHQAALSIYRKQMNTTGGRDAQYAALQAARCYLNLGNKEAAAKLLQSLSGEGSGSSKRQARRLLREL